MLLADRQRDLCEQPAELDRHHAPDQLVAPADLAKISTPRFDVPVAQLFGKQSVDLALRHAMVAAGRLYRLDLSVVDPLLQDRKSTRLNSSHDQISYAVFCLKK